MNLILHLICCGLFASSALSIIDVKNPVKRHIWRGNHLSQTVEEPRYVQTKGGRSPPILVNQNRSRPPCAPHEYGIKSHPNSCQMFVNCTDGQVSVDTCSEGFLFNDATKECDFASNVACSSLRQNAQLQSAQHSSYTSHHTGTDEEVISNFKCPHEGIFEHPHDCTKFIQCAHSGLYVQSCGPGTMFNPSLLVCDWPSNVNCNKNVNANIQTEKPSYNSEFPRNHEGQDRRPTGGADYDNNFDVRMSDTDSRTNNNDQQHRVYSTSAVQSETHATNSRTSQRVNNDNRQHSYPQTSSHTNVQYPPSSSPQYTPSRSIQPPFTQGQPDLTSTLQQSAYPAAPQSRSYQSGPSQQDNFGIITSVQPLDSSRTHQNGYNSSPSYTKTKVYSSQQYNPHHDSNIYTSSTNQGGADTDRSQPLNRQTPTNRQLQGFDQTMDMLDTYANYDTTRRLQGQNSRANVMTVDRTNSDRDHEVPIYNRPARPISARFAPRSSDDIQTEGTEHALPLNDALKLMLSPYTRNSRLRNDDVDEMKTKMLHTATDESEHLSAVVDVTTEAEETNQAIVTEESVQSLDSSNAQPDGTFDDRNQQVAAPTPDTKDLTDHNRQSQTKTGRSQSRASDQYNNRIRSRSDRAEVETFCSSGFDCGNGICLASVKICDGRNDCGNRLDERNCKNIDYDVRLSGDGDRSNVGRLEVKVFDKWGHICGDDFGINEANVFCREAGYPLGAVEVKIGYNSQSQVLTVFDDGPNYLLDELRCSGNETSLQECEFSGWDVRDCNSEQTVGLVCKLPDMKCQLNYWLCDQSEECVPTAFLCDAVKDCTDGSDESPHHCNSTIQYRLGDRKSNTKEGRVEVRYKGIWGTVCDDDFGENEAKVFCRSLGYDGAAAVIKEFCKPGDGLIWLDQVSCSGNETSLEKCTHFEWGENNCNHTEDVYVRCFEQEVGTNQRLTLRDPKSGFSHLNEIPHSSQSDPDHCGQIRVANYPDDYDDQPVFKVIEGRVAKRGHHPWQATLRVRGRNGKSSHWCGAVLVSKTHVLTAAHCLIGFTKNAYFIRFGDHHSEIPEDTEVEIFIEDWHIHEKFRKGHLMNNDIALIKLKSAVKFTDYIQPICLPTEDTLYTVGKNCTISGWGSTQYGKSTPSLHLRSAQIPIMSEEICKQPENYGNSIQSGMFCAGIEDNMIDACDGDSGGPFACQEDDATGYHLLYGIISWGQRCGDRNKPGVYTKVAEYLPWIQEKMLL